MSDWRYICDVLYANDWEYMLDDMKTSLSRARVMNYKKLIERLTPDIAEVKAIIREDNK